jgi:hypothetical protein
LERDIEDLKQNIASTEEVFQQYRDALFVSHQQEYQGYLFIGLTQMALPPPTAGASVISEYESLRAGLESQDASSRSTHSALMALLAARTTNQQSYADQIHQAVHCITQAGFTLFDGNIASADPERNPDARRLIELGQQARSNLGDDGSMDALVQGLSDLRDHLIEQANGWFDSIRAMRHELGRLTQKASNVRGVGFSLQILGLIVVSLEQAFS